MKNKIEKYYKIGEVAEMLGVHEDTLRNWDESGLIVAERVGTRKDRRYTAEHIKQIKEKGLVSDLARRQPGKRDYSEYTKEQLIKELQLLQKQKKYGLVWEDKPEEVVERCKTEAPILKPVPKMNIAGKKDEQRHIMIEGDNYHALQVLNYTHKGKIDVIYIDPPYNTGNKDFMYNDRYIDKEDTYRHSKWLSFMDKRLRLAKDLLSNKGTVFISIDDNEQAGLKLLCDSIFGEENSIGPIIWEKKYAAANDSTVISATHDFILCYAKYRYSWDMGLFSRTEEMNKRYSNPDNDSRGNWKPGGLSAKTYSKAYDYKVKTPKGDYVNPPSGKSWSVPRGKFEEMLKDNRIYFGKNNNSKPQIKQFLSEVQQGSVPKSIWFHHEAGHNQIATQELEKVFGEKIFESPKPVKLIKRIIQVSGNDNNNSTVLDFMAGSGTTGHAVIELNKQDGGNRRFILCTNNENNNGNGHGGIATGVCQPRIKKVMKGYKKNSNGEKIEGLGGNLEYLKTEFVDVEHINRVPDKQRLQFTHEAGHVIALKENAFTEKEKNNWYQIFTDGKDKYVGLYFREDVKKLEELEQKILDKKEVKLYIFSHGGTDVWKGDYARYNNVKVEDIPEPILKVYKGLNS